MFWTTMVPLGSVTFAMTTLTPVLSVIVALQMVLSFCTTFVGLQLVGVMFRKVVSRVKFALAVLVRFWVSMARQFHVMFVFSGTFASVNVVELLVPPTKLVAFATKLPLRSWKSVMLTSPKSSVALQLNVTRSEE